MFYNDLPENKKVYIEDDNRPIKTRVKKLVHKDKSRGNKTTHVNIINVGNNKTQGPFRNFLMIDLET